MTSMNNYAELSSSLLNFNSKHIWSEITARYKSCVEHLSILAAKIPPDVEAERLQLFEREDELLGWQEALIEKALSLEINSDEKANQALDLWFTVNIESKAECDYSESDKLILMVQQYIKSTY